MQFISNIPFTVLNNIGFMAVLYMAYETIKYFSDLPAKYLHNLAALFELMGFVHFLVNIIFAEQAPSLFSISFFRQTQWDQYSTLSYIGILYFIFLIWFLCRTIIRFTRLKKLRSNADFTNSKQWNQTMKDSYGIKKEFIIGTSDLIETPIVFGWADPIILLPIALCNELTMQEVKIILLHEIAHILRHDYIVYLIATVVHGILYFNPFSYFLMKELNLQREMACDQWVLSYSKSSIQYSKILLSIANAQYEFQKKTICLNVMGTRNDLLVRIQHFNNLGAKSLKTFVFSILIALIASSTFFISKKSIITPLVIRQNTAVQNASKIIKTTLLKKAKIAINANQPDMQNISASTIIKKRPNFNKLVDQAYSWIKLHENINQFANYDLDRDSLDYEFAEKIVLSSIVKNYQFKKELLNEKLKQAANQKEAYDFIMNSKEWNQIQDYEKWTKEFLQKHPGTFNRVDSAQLY